MLLNMLYAAEENWDILLTDKENIEKKLEHEYFGIIPFLNSRLNSSQRKNNEQNLLTVIHNNIDELIQDLYPSEKKMIKEKFLFLYDTAQKFSFELLDFASQEKFVQETSALFSRKDMLFIFENAEEVHFQMAEECKESATDVLYSILQSQCSADKMVLKNSSESLKDLFYWNIWAIDPKETTVDFYFRSHLKSYTSIQNEESSFLNFSNSSQGREALEILLIPFMIHFIVSLYPKNKKDSCLQWMKDHKKDFLILLQETFSFHSSQIMYLNQKISFLLSTASENNILVLQDSRQNRILIKNPLNAHKRFEDVQFRLLKKKPKNYKPLICGVITLFACLILILIAIVITFIYPCFTCKNQRLLYVRRS